MNASDYAVLRSCVGWEYKPYLDIFSLNRLIGTHCVCATVYVR